MWIEPPEAKRKERERRQYAKESAEVQRRMKESPPVGWDTYVWGAIFMLLWLSLWFDARF